ncbi:MAG: hypothetical protein IKZ99_06485 [Salinivirgaceae bacterium]|nr:hypothetical protein [Salinivirgaceae bacterium]
MEPNRYSNIGKGGIVKEGIFNRFPDLIPAFSDNYWSNARHKKLIIVGESNYFDDNADSVFKNPEKWYKGDDLQHLIPETKKTDVNNWKAYRSFDRLCKTINNVLDSNCEHVYDEAAFYNYFLRPATVRGKNRSFKKDCTQMDREVAEIALCGIIDIDKPDIVIFVSKYAYMEFMKYSSANGYNSNTLIDYVNHPAHPASWHHKNGNGIHKFEKLLKEHWI